MHHLMFNMCSLMSRCTRALTDKACELISFVCFHRSNFPFGYMPRAIVLFIDFCISIRTQQHLHSSDVGDATERNKKGIGKNKATVIYIVNKKGTTEAKERKKFSHKPTRPSRGASKTTHKSMCFK